MAAALAGASVPMAGSDSCSVAQIEANPDLSARAGLPASLRARKFSSTVRTERCCGQYRPARVPLWFWPTDLA